MRTIRAVLSGVCLTISACAGDGDGLDENGRPLDEAAEPLQATFESIQDKVFTPICTNCHGGAGAPLGLRLDEGAAFAMLVNAPSVEAPTLARVTPGDPDASYLIQKLEGSAAVGERMPLNAPPLPAETIAIIRQWIIDGAQPPVSAAADEKPATLTALWPVEGATLSQPPREILLSSESELDAALLDVGTLVIRSSGGDADFSNGGERRLAGRVELRSLAPTVFALQIPAGEWNTDQYELRISGGTPVALADRSARPIDGDNDGAPGGDFVLRFTLEDER